MPDWITPRLIAAIVSNIVAIAGLIIWFQKKSSKSSYWKGEVDTDRMNFKVFMSEIREDMGEIRNKFEEILRRLPRTLLAGSSPLRLTDLGEKAATAVRARDWAQKRSGDLIDECQGLKEHQIYERCQEYVTANRERWPVNMDECAYAFGVSVNQLAGVLGIVLRDVLLAAVDKGE